MQHFLMKIAFVSLMAIVLSSCKLGVPAVYKNVVDCKYQRDERYVNIALGKDGELFLEQEQLSFPELYPALVDLKRAKYQQLRKKEQLAQRYFVINFCTHPESDYAEVLKVRGILKKWDTILIH